MATRDEQGNMKQWADLSGKEKQEMMNFLKKMREEPSAPVKQAPIKQFQLKGYVRCELAKGDRDNFDSWSADLTVDKLFGSMLAMADNGYIVKLGPQENGFSASVSAWQTHSPNDGYVLTAHAGDPKRAWALLVWKHEVIMAADWALWIGDGEGEFLR